MPKHRKYPATVVIAVRNELRTLAETPGPTADYRGLAARQVVERLRKDIEKALDRGHPIEAVAATMKNHGVELSLATMRKYWRQAAADADAHQRQLRNGHRRFRRAPVFAIDGKSDRGDDEPAIPKMPERV